MWRCATRRRGAPPQGGDIEVVYADVRDGGTVAQAVSDSDAVVNAVGLYVPQGKATFQAVHVDGAQKVARDFPGFLIYLLSTGVSFCGDVGVAAEVRGSGRIRDPNQLIPMIKMVIMAQIHMKIFKPFDRAIRETHCLKVIVINLFR